MSKPASAARKPISKKVRFEIFKRDGFTCAYCGAHPPAVVLQVDHIEPVSKGGTNAIDNLITACSSCNLGKSDRLLSAAPATVAEKARLLAEKEEQLMAYRAMLKQIKDRESEDIQSIEDVFSRSFKGLSFTERFRDNIRWQFLPKIDAQTLADHMSIACARIDEPERAIRYFCGINWRVIKEQEDES